MCVCYYRRWRSFEKFHLEPHSRCEFDSVSLYDGAAVASAHLLGRYCGFALPPDVVSASSTLTVNFATDSSRTGEGFFATYTAVYGTIQMNCLRQTLFTIRDAILACARKPT